MYRTWFIHAHSQADGSLRPREAFLSASFGWSIVAALTALLPPGAGSGGNMGEVGGVPLSTLLTAWETALPGRGVTETFQPANEGERARLRCMVEALLAMVMWLRSQRNTLFRRGGDIAAGFRTLLMATAQVRIMLTLAPPPRLFKSHSRCLTITAKLGSLSFFSELRFAPLYLHSLVSLYLLLGECFMTYCSFASASAHHYSPQALPWTRCIAAAGSVGEVDDKSGRSTDHVKNLQLCALACAAVLEVRCNSLMYANGDIKCCLYFALRNASLLTPCHFANLMLVWSSCTGSCIASSAAAVAAGRTRAARLPHVCHGGAGAD